MFDEFDFHVEQLLSINAVMTDIPSFQPDGETTVTVDAMIAEADTIRTAMQTQVSTIAIARGEMAEITKEMHDLCVQVFAIMKSRYRQDPGSYDAIAKLPVDDDSPTETNQRAQAISHLWALLPNPPGSATPFKAWDTMGRTEFDAKLTAFETTLNGMVGVEQSYERVQGDFRAKRTSMAKWITAALAQGRGQFPKGTPQREQIDAIPTYEGTPKPAKAIIESAISPQGGVVLIKFNSNHATTFRLLAKGPGATEFTLFADELTSDTYEQHGLPVGVYHFKAVGKNARGLGPESDPAEVTIA